MSGPPNISHVLEQYSAFWRDFATQTVPVYFKSLVAAELTREEALALTISWQNTIITITIGQQRRSE